MWCDPPSIPSADVTQPTQSNWPSVNDNKQLSFVYQPGVGLYDKKKIDLDQDLRIPSITADVDERIQPREPSPLLSGFTSDVDHRWSSSSSSIESSSPTTKTDNFYKTCLRRQNEQESLPIRQKSVLSDDILLNKHTKSLPSNNTHYHIQLFNINNSNVNITTSQENNLKRKVDENLFSNKKSRHSISPITTFRKYHSWSNEQTQSQSLPKSTSSNSLKLPNENLKCEKNLLDEELNRQKAKLISIEQQRRKRPSSPIKLRLNSNERLQKQSITTITKNIPMVSKSSENEKLDQVQSIPSQGLLLCPKIEPIKKKKKKKIASIITESTKSLDDDPVLDSILFDEMHSIQQQWQQFMTLTMEKEFHTNPSDGKKKIKRNKFNRTYEFLSAYENLYDFEGMKHWYPTSR